MCQLLHLFLRINHLPTQKRIYLYCLQPWNSLAYQLTTAKPVTCYFTTLKQTVSQDRTIVV